jgi:hypothetical protein
MTNRIKKMEKLAKYAGSKLSREKSLGDQRPTIVGRTAT